MLTPDQKNQITHEAMGKCWHEFEFPHKNNGTAPCRKCNSFDYPNPDYSKWEHYGPMLEWAMTKEWWEDFIPYLIHKVSLDYTQGGSGKSIYPYILNPTRGRDAIAEFLKEWRK